MQKFYCRNWRFSGLRFLFLIGLFITIVLPITKTYAQIEESADIIIYGDVRLYVDSAEQILVHGSLSGIDGAVLENQGELILNVEDEYQSINNYSSNAFFIGNGEYRFIGPGDIYVGGDFSNTFYNVTFEKEDGAYMILGSDFQVSNRLNLVRGRIETSDLYSLSLLNKSSDSLIHEELSRDAFVFGRLRRYIRPGEEYQYPVGLSDTYFPLRINNSMEGVEYLDVEFRDDVALDGYANHQAGLYNFGELNQTGAWNIVGEKTPSSGSMDISAYLFDFIEYSSLETNMFGLMYNPNPGVVSDEWVLEGDFALPGMPTRREGSIVTELFGAKNYGSYALTIGDITKLINFISPGEDRETLFIIPGAVDDETRGWKQRYEETELVVYNAMGREIYKSKPYLNDLDMKDYRDGTYYYIFRYVRNGKPGTIQSYIDVKRVY